MDKTPKFPPKLRAISRINTFKAHVINVKIRVDEEFDKGNLIECVWDKNISNLQNSHDVSILQDWNREIVRANMGTLWCHLSSVLLAAFHAIWFINCDSLARCEKQFSLFGTAEWSPGISVPDQRLIQSTELDNSIIWWSTWFHHTWSQLE